MVGELINSNFFERIFKKITIQKLLILHFAINSLGLIALSMIVSSLLAKSFQPNIYDYVSLYSWAKPTGGTGLKLASLLQYVLSIIALLIHYIIYLYVAKSINHTNSVLLKYKLTNIFAYFFTIVIVNGLIILSALKHFPVLVFAVLFSLWWFSFCIFITDKSKIAIPKLALRVFFFVLVIQYVFVFLPLIFTTLTIKNDYINISERTILKSGKVVDNLDYINQHKIAGLQINDPRRQGNPNQNIISNLREKVESCQIIIQSLKAINEKNEQSFFCENDNDFVALRPFTINEKALLATLEISKKDRQNIDKLSISSMNLDQSIQQRQYSSEEQDFLSKNAKELVNQSKAGWFLYHHGYNFGVMNAINLGAIPNTQTMVYGWLSTTFQAKLLKAINSSTYQDYFKMFFASYLIYFAVFLCGIWAIFKRFNTLVFATLTSVTAIVCLGTELIQLAPGFNPIRHFFDVVIFYFFYQYLVKNNWLYLLCASCLAIFAILWSKDFGLFITLSLVAAIAFKAIKDQKIQISLLILGIVLGIAGVFFYFYPFPGANPTAIYMLIGVGSPLASTKSIFILLVLVSILLYTNIVIKQNNSLAILSVAMAFYFVQSLTYYIWYPQMHHILGIAPVFIFWLTILFHGLNNSGEETIVKKYGVLLISPLVLIYLVGSIIFYWNNYGYFKEFKEHQLYTWSFDSAKFESTMDPMLFKEGAQLIKKYSTNQNAIFIVSKYDHVLPILANRYSAMPYNELLTNLVSPKEVKLASDHIFKNNPDYVFIDTDINKNLNGEVPVALDPATIRMPALLGEARSRIKVMQGLKAVSADVEKKYSICEAGRLISVYCRKQD